MYGSVGLRTWQGREGKHPGSNGLVVSDVLAERLSLS